MPMEIFVARDFEQMSEIAASRASRTIESTLLEKAECVLGLATGNSPTGLYRRLAEIANRDGLDSTRWRTFNLDEYVGLPGSVPSERAAHPESYHVFMERSFFALLIRRPNRTDIPPGHEIDSERLRQELEDYPEDWASLGTSGGRALVIRAGARSSYLRWVRDEVLSPYETAIRQAGGMDLQILGIGGGGHVAFHEAGIPFDLPGLLLVQLDEVTREHAVEDGHFASLEQAPRFALTMSVQLVFQARQVLVLANGNRKREAVTRSILWDPTPEMPMSYAQIYSKRGGEVTLILDKMAAEGLLAEPEALNRRGYRLINLIG